MDSFNASSTTRKVTLQSWPDHESALADVLAGNAPDAFLTSRIDLDQLVEGEALQPVSLLLDERGVDFGDRFSRDAVDAFAMDDELQCMAYSVSPMVVYYNTDLVDFDKMERRGLDVPSVTDEGKRERWTLAEFGRPPGSRRAAATRAASGSTRPCRGWRRSSTPAAARSSTTTGADVPGLLRRQHPRGAEPDALHPARLVADADQRPAGRATPVQLFKRGELAMVAGFRNLVPEMREADDLDFDVLPMPTIDTRATVGDISGLCISADSEVTGDAADFIAYAVSDAAIATVASTGYIVPANTSVAASPEFLAPDDEPASAEVYNQSIRYMVVPPFIDQREELIDAVTPLLEQLVTAPGALDLEATTEEIDQTSQEILSPEETESPRADRGPERVPVGVAG